MITEDQTEVLNLLVQGAMPMSDPERAADAAIALLSRTAETQPKFLVEAIRDVVQIRIDNMIMVALACLSAKAPEEFLAKRGIQVYIMNMLAVYNPPAILEYVELLRSKELGRGFGARPQKWVKDVLHGLRLDTLQEYIKDFPKEMCALVRLAHPKYVGPRGELVKKLLQEEKYGLVC